MIYLDNAALQKPKQECIDVALDVMKNQWGNASSTYEFGRESKRIVEHTRELIAKEINCSPKEIILCGSGSEANSLAIDGWLSYYGHKYVITSVIEHPSILNNENAFKRIECDADGKFNYSDLNDCFIDFVSLQFANSEIGIIQDIKDITKELHSQRCMVHTDAVQAFGHIPIDVQDLGVDMLSATAQKIGGILGSAFLYVKDGINLNSIIHGNQEDGLRGGTYNVPAIASFGKAIELIDYSVQDTISSFRWNLYYSIQSVCKKLGIELKLNGSMLRLPNNLSLTFKGINAEQLITLMDLRGYCFSAGSACCSGEATPSRVLKAIGLSDEEAFSTVRITLGEENTLGELDRFINDLEECLITLKK